MMPKHGKPNGLCLFCITCRFSNADFIDRKIIPYECPANVSKLYAILLGLAGTLAGTFNAYFGRAGHIGINLHTDKVSAFHSCRDAS